MASAEGHPLEMRKCTSGVTPSHVTLEERIEIPWLEESLDVVRSICRKVVSRWSKIPPDQLRVEKVSGGITNILFSVTPAAPLSGDPVIVRIFGPMTEKVIDRARELQTMQVLSDCGFGAELIGRFGNGVVQSYISACTLTTEEMRSPRLVPLIAAALSRFHSLEVPGPREPQLWHTLEGYLATARGLVFEDRSKQAQFQAVDLDTLARDIEYVQCAAGCVRSPVVFSHNDFIAGNIMFSKEQGVLHLIDFEYSSFGFRGYDIANHFCEYAGLEADYSKYPTREQQILFFRHYLNPAEPDQVSERELSDLANEVAVFASASHLFWALWALIQARYSPIDFDYMGYFKLRYAEYRRMRALQDKTHSNGTL